MMGARSMRLAILLLAYHRLIVSGMSIKDPAMESEDLDFPMEPISDSIAGAPGSQIAQAEGLGPAHNLPREDVELPCDMNEETITNEGQQPFKPPAPQSSQNTTEPPTHAPTISVPGSHKPTVSGPNRSKNDFVCHVSRHFPAILPPITSPFDISAAVDAGSDQGGDSDITDYAVTECACTCGNNPSCGSRGDLSYFSQVPTSIACAQMICHPFQFSSCLWSSVVVSAGVWDNNTMTFNSSVLFASTGSNATGMHPVAHLPSPSPSPSHQPSREEQIVLRAVSQLGSIKEKLCLRLSSAVVSSILDDLESVDLSQPATFPCFAEVHVQLPLHSTNSITDLKQSNDAIQNALAGYNEGSPLAGDRTRHASLNMNMGINLIQVDENSSGIEKDAWNLLVRLFQNNIASEYQCAPNVPPMDSLLRSAEYLKPCNASLLRIPRNTMASAIDLYVRVFQDLVDHLTPIESHGAMPASTVGQSEDWSPDEYDPTSMISPDLDDCTQDSAKDETANYGRVEDTQGRAPGARPPMQAITSTIVSDLPEFGKQELVWGERPGSKVLLTQPAERE